MCFENLLHEQKKLKESIFFINLNNNYNSLKLVGLKLGY